MRTRRFFTIDHGFQPIDIIPLLNIFVLMLIFFVFFPYLTFSPAVRVEFPKTITSDIVREENLVITVTSENVIYLRNKIISLKDLKNELLQEHRNAAILIKADSRVSLGRVMDVWDLCRAAGIGRINIATNREQ